MPDHPTPLTAGTMRPAGTGSGEQFKHMGPARFLLARAMGGGHADQFAPGKLSTTGQTGLVDCCVGQPNTVRSHSSSDSVPTRPVRGGLGRHRHDQAAQEAIATVSTDRWGVNHAYDNDGAAVFAQLRRSVRPSKTSQDHGIIGNGVTVTGAKLLPSLTPVVCYR